VRTRFNKLNSIVKSLMRPSTNAYGFSASPVLPRRICAYREVAAICLAMSTADTKLYPKNSRMRERLVKFSTSLDHFMDGNLPEISTRSDPDLFEESRRARWGYKSTLLAPTEFGPLHRTFGVAIGVRLPQCVHTSPKLSRAYHVVMRGYMWGGSSSTKNYNRRFMSGFLQIIGVFHMQYVCLSSTASSPQSPTYTY
jgi:hypothetical protein